MTSTLRIATEKDIMRYMSKGRNILLVGEHGIGKTTILKSVCASLGWKMVVFNGATMDAYIDLVGIPEVVTKGDKRVLEKIRQETLEDADVVFIDEINRGNPTTLNGTMEMVNEGSINGVPLPNLKCVVAAINPVNSAVGGSYMVSSLDPAQMDRFDVTMGMSNRAKADIVTKILISKGYDPDDSEIVAKIICRWQNSLDFSSTSDQRAPYVSPRKVVQMGIGFLDFRDKLSLIHCLGECAGNININALYSELADKVDEERQNEEDKVEDPFIEALHQAVKINSPVPLTSVLQDTTILNDVISDMSKNINPDDKGSSTYIAEVINATAEMSAEKAHEKIFKPIMKSIPITYGEVKITNFALLGLEDAHRTRTREEKESA